MHQKVKIWKYNHLRQAAVKIHLLLYKITLANKIYYDGSLEKKSFGCKE